MNNIKLFQNQKVRTHWDEEQEKWYFSVVDIVAILTESSRPRKYWNALKTKLTEEGSQLSHKLGQLKMKAPDGKMRLTDVLDTEGVLRLVQSIPSPKAEPFKLWLAEVGYQRMEEIEDPELGINRLMQTYLRKGYSKSWINQRLKSIEVRKELTDEWNRRGIKKQKEYAILTDEITKAWSGKSVKQYKKFKNLQKQSLRDNMTNMELVLNMLAEATTKEISQERQPETFTESQAIAKEGGDIVGQTRKNIEAKTGKKIVSSQNAKNYLEG